MLLANANSIASSYFARSQDLPDSRQACYLFPVNQWRKTIPFPGPRNHYHGELPPERLFLAAGLKMLDKAELCYPVQPQQSYCTERKNKTRQNKVLVASLTSFQLELVNVFKRM